SANPSCSTSNREFLDPKKKKEIESWLGDSRIVDSFDGTNEIEYFDTFPTLEELEYQEWIFKYPKPSWVKAKVRTGNLNNIKISCKIGHFFKRQAYIDLESPINVMSKQHYNKIMNKGLESRQKPSNPSKNINFIGRVKGLKVFIGNFIYKCNFMILEDTTSIIDHHLGEIVFGKPFARNTGLVYDQEKGTVTFKKDDEKITFIMPHKMEASNHINFKDINTDSIPPSVLESNDDRGKTYCSDSLTLGPEYREDESLNLVNRALFTSLVAAKSSKLGATLVVVKSRFSVATPQKATNKVSSASSLTPESRQSQTLSAYMKNQIKTSKKWKKCGCSKHMTGNLKLLRNFVEKFMDTVRFGNDNFAEITRYGDYVQGNLTICHVYYDEGPRHNHFSVGQFCDGDLEVAFQSNTCFIRNLEGEYLFTSSRETNLYTISISEMAASSPVCLMSKATSIKSWLWHR
ncbi:protein kinase-like domain, concanavalin A-like lectin/glucanase domain protein, partial [Tanacetum coccineum]